MSVHPLDHVLRLCLQARSDMTTVANVTLKLRKNGGVATTYTNVSTPAIAQMADATNGYLLDIAASTYADGDKLEWTWLYSSAVVAVGSAVVTPAAPNGANLDAAVSSRSTYAGGDTSGTTTLLSRLSAGRATGLDYLDAAITGRASQASVDTIAGYVDTEVAAIKAKTDNLPTDPADASDIAAATGALASAIAALPSAASIATAVWASGTRTLSSFGTLVADTTTAVWAAVARTLTASPGPTAAAVADAVLDELVADHTTAGSLSATVTGFDARLGAGRVTVVSPVSADGATVDVYQGDDYANAEGRALTFDITSAGDLTTYTSFSFTVDGGFTKTASAVDADTLRVADILASDLSSLTVRSYPFDVSGVKGGHARTLIRGQFVVHSDVS